jgi:type IV pilus assembly protein PilB
VPRGWPHRYRLSFVDLEERSDRLCADPVPADRPHAAPQIRADAAGERTHGHCHGRSVRPSPARRAEGAARRSTVTVEVATGAAIENVLRKGDASQRVLQEATEGFRAALVKETEQGEEVLDLDRLSGDSEMSPIIKLVDTIVFTSLEKRASDIHHGDARLGHGGSLPYRWRPL